MNEDVDKDEGNVVDAYVLVGNHLVLVEDKFGCVGAHTHTRGRACLSSTCAGLVSFHSSPVRENGQTNSDPKLGSPTIRHFSEKNAEF